MNLASKHAGSEAGWIILAHRLASGPVPFGQNLTVSQNPITSRLVLHNMIRAICGRMQQSLKLEIGRRPVAFCQTGPDKSCTLACFWTRCACPKPHPAIQIGSGSVFHNMILAFFGRKEPNWMQEVGSGIHNPA